MANDATLTDLQNRALDYADMTGSAFPVTARLIDYINAGYSELYEMLIAAYGSDYVRSTSTTALVGGTEEYALPTDFYKMIRVWEVVGSSRYSVDRFELSHIAGFKTTGPASAGTLSLWYAPQLVKLASGSDVIHVSVCTGWEDFIALHAAIRLLSRQQTDTSALMAERETIRQRIIDNAGPRDLGIPGEIEDHYQRWGGIRDDQGATQGLRYRVMGNKLVVVQLSEAV